MKFRIVQNGLCQFSVQQKRGLFYSWQEIYVPSYEQGSKGNTFLLLQDARNFMNKKIAEYKSKEAKKKFTVIEGCY